MYNKGLGIWMDALLSARFRVISIFSCLEYSFGGFYEGRTRYS